MAFLPPHPARPATRHHTYPVGHPSFGVNAHLATRYPDPSSMAVPATLLQELGVSWVREDFHWYRIQPEPGEWEWTFNDAAMRELVRRRINVLGVIGGPAPPWATPYEGDAPQYASFHAPDTEHFVTFARAVVTRYHHVINHWEIWNEPDNILFWRPHPDPAAYADLLIRTSDAIRAIDPEARVLIGGINPFDQRFLRVVLDAGAWESFDILAIHPYVDPLSPEQGNIAAAIDLVRVLTSPYERQDRQQGKRTGEKPIWVTEVGWASGPGDHDRQGQTNEQMQASYLVRSMLLLWESGIERVFWYTLKDDPGNPYGLIGLGEGRADYRRRKPSFFAFKTLNAQVKQARFIERRDLFTHTVVLNFDPLGDWMRPVQPNGIFESSGAGSARIRYHFSTPGNDYVVFERAEPLLLPEQPHALGLWVYGDGSGHRLNVWLRDAENEVLQVHLGTVGPSGWQFLSAPIGNSVFEGNHISGQGNGRVDFPASVAALVLDDFHNDYQGRGIIYLDDLTAIQGREVYDFRFDRAGQEYDALDILWSPPTTYISLDTRAAVGRLVEQDGSERTISAQGGQLLLTAEAQPRYVWHIR
jgi:hypothetical protein